MGIVRALRDSTPEQGMSDVAIPSNAALVDAALNGQSWAQEALFRRHARMAGGLAHRLLVGSDIDVDDVVQDSFLTAFGKLDTLRAPEAFSSWLGSIVVRLSSKRLRRHRLRVKLGLARSEEVNLDLAVSKEAPPDVRVQIEQIYSLLERLKPDERIALLLRRVEGLTVSEIAAQMDSSLSTVKRRLRDAEARLDRALYTKRLTAGGPTSAPSFSDNNYPSASSPSDVSTGDEIQ